MILFRCRRRRLMIWRTVYTFGRSSLCLVGCDFLQTIIRSDGVQTINTWLGLQKQQQFERQFLQTCQAQRGNTNADIRQRVILEYPCQGNMFVMSGKEQSSHCLYAIGIRDAGYPERFAYSCLGEVMERVHMTQVGGKLENRFHRRLSLNVYFLLQWKKK